MFRRRPKPSPDPLDAIDPRGLPRRFAAPVAEALDARRSFRDLVAGLRPGPVQERMAEMGAQVEAGVQAVWETAQRAAELERILTRLDPDRVTADYKQARRTGSESEVAAHAQRFSSVQRLMNTLDDTQDRLDLSNARLGAAVAHAAEVALSAGTGTGAEELDTELASVVADLGALKSALDEVS